MQNFSQIHASEPTNSVWVSASAGTGKTKILTDRILKLLINNVRPSKILCLTFTNAAAAEMEERVRQKLEYFSTLSSVQIRKELELISDTVYSDAEIERCKNLYSKLINFDDDINIHTLHSYCQKILQKFPLEAGITPSFQILDEMMQYRIIKDIKKQLLSLDILKPIMRYFAQNFHQGKIDEIFTNFINSGNKIKVDIKDKPELIEAAITILESDFPAYYDEVLKNDITYKLAQFKEIDCENENELISLFLTKNGDKKKKIAPAKFLNTKPSLEQELTSLQERIFQLDQKRKKSRVKSYSYIISILHNYFCDFYENYKKVNNVLDYNDLITKTQQLLTNKEVRNWVLYKLDGGIDHILVDEAQDTSKEQWQIIKALTEEFYASNDPQNLRTIFIVGDQKQSIFSFQGADIAEFMQMNQYFRHKFLQHQFQNITLDTSYRSAKAILDVVYKLFANLEKSCVSFDQIPDLKAHFNNRYGKVELWPIFYQEKHDQETWQIDSASTHNARTELAQAIAHYIDQEIKNGAASSNDFLLLFRSRSDFTIELIKQLQALNINSSGLDRIKLHDELVIKDIIACANYAICPTDDLNLAALLKSPLFGVGDMELEKIILSEPSKPICEKFANHDLNIIRHLYDNNSAINFILELINYFQIRQNSLAYYGCEISEILGEFIKLVYQFQKNYGNSVADFLVWLQANDIDIKKKNDEQADGVRLMTVHASKGLQAKYVIICDAASTPINSENIYRQDDQFISAASSKDHYDEFIELKESKNIANHREYLRLLYVAMTRAEEKLIICGHSNKKEISSNCWYKLVENAIYAITENNFYETNQESFKDQQFQNKPKVNYFEAPTNKGQAINPPEDILHQAVLSPLAINNSAQYGIIFHKIMEDILSSRNPNAEVEHPLIQTLNAEEQISIATSLKRIFANELFLNIIKSKIYTEITVGQQFEESKQIIGRIDLLIETDEELIIIDYKTDKKADSYTEVPKSYLDQLEQYRRLLLDCTSKTILSYILWAKTGSLQQIHPQ